MPVKTDRRFPRITASTKRRIVAEAKRLRLSTADITEWALEVSSGRANDVGSLHEGEAGIMLLSMLPRETPKAADTPPPIDEAFSAFLTSAKTRPTHGGLHVSDVSNGCARAVHARIYKGIKTKFDAVTHCKMEQGFSIEDIVRKALSKKLRDYTVRKSVAVAFDPAPPYPTALFFLREAHKVSAEQLIGHPDLVLDAKDGSETIVGEVKSTQWYRSGYLGVTPPTIDELRIKNQNYILQGAAYAKAFGAARFFVIVVDRGTGQWKTYWFDTDEEWPAFERRWQMMRQAVATQDVPPPSLPVWTIKKDGHSYLCASCPVKRCSLNPARLKKSLKVKAASLAS